MEMTTSNIGNQGFRPEFLLSRNLDFQAKVQAQGEEIFRAMENEGKSIFNKDWWYGRIMDWSMKNEHFKTQMFRFVDVLPYLSNSSEVAKHLKEYFAEKGEELPSIFNFGVGVGSLAPGLLAGAVKKNVQQMAKMFITGESPKEALPVLKKARKNHLCFTVDLLGEATLSESEAKDYDRRYRELIEWIAEDAKTWAEIPQLDRDENGAIPKVNVSVKLTSLFSQIKETAWETSVETLKDRLRPLLELAVSNGVFINIDMEQYSHKDLTLDVFEQILLEEKFKSYPYFGIVIQAYLRDSLADCHRLIQFAKHRGTPFTIRLVKGAYWDYEVIHAQQKGWPIPVFTNKKESDLNYEICAEELIKAYPHIRVAIGSHNVRSIAACIVLAEQYKLPQAALELQMLYGMADQIKKTLVKKGFRVREYATIGELIPGMAYLVRRLLENTSNESFLRSKFADNVSTEKLLKDPGADLNPTSSMLPKSPELFYNCPTLDFAELDCRRKMQQALTQRKAQAGQVYPLVINDKEVKTERTLKSVNPSHPTQVVGEVMIADVELAEQAVQAAKARFPKWSKVAVEERAQYLEKLGALLERDRYDLSALQVLEVGKTWEEADADVCEAIDFCRYYAREMRRLGVPKRTGHAPGELSLYHYLPKGVSLVIAPWNFPLAILTGMTAAAMVTGNTVVMKPAEQSSVIAAELMKRIREAGLPAGVVNFAPGYGEEIGEYLSGHKDISLIAFTGSKEVGLKIIQKAGFTLPGQLSVKRCIIEMGGKNAVIVDSDADLDEAVAGIIYSAFGFQGQKCSACSRVLIVESLYDRFVERLKPAVESLIQGPSEDPKVYLGPVIDKDAFDKIQSIIQSAKTYSELLYQGSPVGEGYFIPPTVFSNVDSNSPLAQEEIFGPVLALIKVKDLDHAIEVANSTAYALTGGLYSRSPANIEKVRQEFMVGNLYINRGNTGALVERHPFGGFKMSGVGSKAGGPDYLLQFMDPRVITENTMRRGFAPAEEGDA